MTNRMTVAVGALLLCVSSTFAQAPAELPPAAKLPVGTPPTGAPPAGVSPGGVPPAGMPSTAPTESPTGLPSSRLTDTTAPGFTTAPASAGGEQAFWASADMMFSWFRGVTLPPLVTTSPLGTPAGTAGILGQPTTSTQFGGGQAEDNIRYGFRVETGYWFGSDRILGVEAGMMILGTQNTPFAISSSTNPILARPYTDATDFTQQAALVAFPGVSNGSVNVTSTSGHFYSGNLDFDLKVVDEGWFRLTAMAGYRYYRYDESLGIQDTIEPISPVFVAGTQITSTDRFATRNLFNGLDLGVRPQIVWGPWTLDMLLRVAAGNLHHTVDIEGEQVVSVPGFAPVANLGGVYALPTNIGLHGSSDWVVTPEVAQISAGK